MSEQILILDGSAWLVVGQAGVKVMSFLWPVFLVFIAGMLWEYKKEKQRAVCKVKTRVV